MKKILIVAFFSIFIISIAKAEEITLFDKKGEAIAYIDDDNDMTIYMWDGEPVAYLVKKGDSENPKTDKFSIYGFNGKHLGWLIKGIARDHDGNATGFVKGAVNQSTKYEPYKSYKQYKPYKSYKDYEPYMPYLSDSWSEIPLKYFLKEGKD